MLTAGVVQNDRGTSLAQRAAIKQLWGELRKTDAAHSDLGVSCTVSGAGHYIQLDKPNIVAEAVLETIRAGKMVKKPVCMRLK